MLKDPLPDLASICSFSNSSHRTLVAIGLHQPSQDIFHDILAEGWHSRFMKLFFFRNQKVFHYCKCSVVDKLGWEINNHVTSSSGDYGPKPETKNHSPKTQPFFLEKDHQKRVCPTGKTAPTTTVVFCARRPSAVAPPRLRVEAVIGSGKQKQ